MDIWSGTASPLLPGDPAGVFSRAIVEAPAVTNDCTAAYLCATPSRVAAVLDDEDDEDDEDPKKGGDDGNIDPDEEDEGFDDDDDEEEDTLWTLSV